MFVKLVLNNSYPSVFGAGVFPVLTGNTKIMPLSSSSVRNNGDFEFVPVIVILSPSAKSEPPANLYD